MGTTIGGSWLDAKLGVRMLFKHPGLTLAAVFALAVGIPVGMAPTHLAHAIFSPLPEDPGHRIRAIRYWDVATNGSRLVSSYELSRWEEDLSTFETVGAFRRHAYNVGSEVRRAAGVSGAEVTASTFQILGTPPALGRSLDRSDERTGAPNVVVMGHDLWESRFAGDPEIVGRTIPIGDVPFTVVGVMPPGFYFPSREQLWVPLREEPLSEPGAPGLQVFGRLAEGVDARAAQAEVAAFGERVAQSFPDTNANLRAEVVTWGVAFNGLPSGGSDAIPGFFSFRILCLALLLVACANVAMLVFARTATRFRELAIRTALGAGRARVVSQLFIESVVLAVSAAGAGLLGYSWLLSRVRSLMESSERMVSIPYWLDVGVTWETVAWALVFAIVSAAVVGVLPALRVTGEKVQHTIQRSQASRSGTRFGGVTGALIVADVTIAVAAVGLAVGLADRVRDSSVDQSVVGIPAEEYLLAEVSLQAYPERDDVTRDAISRLASVQETLSERLASEPDVRGVAFASRLPRMDHNSRQVEVEGEREVADLGFFEGLNRWVAVSQVAVDYFEELDQPIVSGRAFDRADTGDDVAVVIVNTSFVDRILGGRNPIGRRIRFLASSGQEPSPWYEIVGVAPRLGMNVAIPEHDTGVYLPAAPGEIHPLRFAVHLGANPETFAPRLREIVSEVDPSAALAAPVPLDRVFNGNWYLFFLASIALSVLVLILIAMATSGIYAIMSFAVSQRTREIGVRTALGAQKASIVFRVARRSFAQIGGGALLGVPLAAWAFQLTETGPQGASGPLAGSFGVAFGTGLAVVTVVGLVSCLAPMRRALRIEPTEALRAEG